MVVRNSVSRVEVLTERRERDIRCQVVWIELEVGSNEPTRRNPNERSSTVGRPITVELDFLDPCVNHSVIVLRVRCRRTVQPDVRVRLKRTRQASTEPRTA